MRIMLEMPRTRTVGVPRGALREARREAVNVGAVDSVVEKHGVCCQPLLAVCCRFTSRQRPCSHVCLTLAHIPC